MCTKEAKNTIISFHNQIKDKSTLIYRLNTYCCNNQKHHSSNDWMLDDISLGLKITTIIFFKVIVQDWYCIVFSKRMWKLQFKFAISLTLRWTCDLRTPCQVGSNPWMSAPTCSTVYMLHMILLFMLLLFVLWVSNPVKQYIMTVSCNIDLYNVTLERQNMFVCLPILLHYASGFILIYCKTSGCNLKICFL